MVPSVMSEVVLPWSPGQSYDQVVTAVLKPELLPIYLWVLPALLAAASFGIEVPLLRVLAWVGVAGLVVLYAWLAIRKSRTEAYRAAMARCQEFLDNSQLRGAYGGLQVAYEAVKWARPHPKLDAQGHVVKGEDGKPVMEMDYPSTEFVTAVPAIQVRLRIDTRGGIAPAAAIAGKCKDIQSYLGYNDWTATTEIPMSSHVDIVLSLNRVGGIYG